MKEIINETEKLLSKINQIDFEILESNLPFRIKIEFWENPKFNPLNEVKQSVEVKEYIKAKIETYPDPRVIFG